jgi:hypothetical protein
MNSDRPITNAVRISALMFALGAMLSAQTPSAKSPYPSMASLDQYLMARETEIALARTAAPESISRDARILVLGRHGYETAAEGKNGFVCIVQRSWTAGIDDPEFWNPHLRAPICYNAAGARSYLALVTRKTELILAGQSKENMSAAITAAIDKKELPTPETGAMCYMLSKQGHLSDRDGHWHPHLMFFVPSAEAAAWGANKPGSPVLAAEVPTERLTIFLVPVSRWSDGTIAPPFGEDAK